MTIDEFLNRDNNIHFPSIPNDSATNVSRFFEKAIQIPHNPETIIKWHKLLTRYMEDPQAVILSRLYESDKDFQTNEWHTRRGFLTQMADGFSYACASNHFARIIFTMAYYDFVPEYDDFLKMFTERRISLFSYRGTTDVEDKYAAFKKRFYATKFYTPGWYLAHIIAVKDDEYSGFPNVDIRNIITKGTEDQWNNAEGYYVRKLPEILSPDQKKIAKAQFLRFIDPMNYFLVPGQNNVSIHNIGEKKDIIDFMKKKYSNTFGDKYTDFMQKALGKEDQIPLETCEELGRKRINVSFGLNIRRAPTNINAHVHNVNQQHRQHNANPKQFTNKQKAKCLKAYLFDGLSYRRLETNILNIESSSRGGGFIAQKMMRDFGLVTTNKGMFERRNLTQALNQAEGSVKSALEFIRDNLPEHV